MLWSFYYEDCETILLRMLAPEVVVWGIFLERWED